MFALREALPGHDLPMSWSLARGVASGLAGLGIVLAVLGVREFRRAMTTVDPRFPAKASALVSGGVYRYSRNPMYLGMLLCLTALFVHLRSLPAGLLLPCFVLYMNHYQIAPEERAMRERFGEVYAEYRARVRRWI
ncbi:MAG: isoprenylcysteine carboxylmethyltransferase family protein [Pseudomonadota bacterium]